MNANELANLLEVDSWYKLVTREEIATMLRQQQAEIEALKNIVERLIADWTDGFRNYEYNSDEPEENKLRDDVFAILRKAQEK
jgi:hypothetical protein